MNIGHAESRSRCKKSFGILTEIDVKSTLKTKLDVAFRKYRILGASKPPYAYRALQTEPHIGTMLPCNVIVQALENGYVEVAAIDPLASMQVIGNPELQEKLKAVIKRIS